VEELRYELWIKVQRPSVINAFSNDVAFSRFVSDGSVRFRFGSNHPFGKGSALGEELKEPLVEGVNLLAGLREWGWGGLSGVHTFLFL
jgi:hypothetical protein